MMKTKVWAHRGASACAPENTLEAFELAVSQGADGVELDIQMTKDGSLAVIHDETVDRVCDGSGCVADLTMKELKRFRCSRLHPEFGEARIPELGEVLSLLKPTKLTVNIELKTGIVHTWSGSFFSFASLIS
ncbi:glycerophosphodiester phosphodiesterase family protein, partial [Hungatella hathewayi]